MDQFSTKLSIMTGIPNGLHRAGVEEGQAVRGADVIEERGEGGADEGEAPLFRGVLARELDPRA